MEYLSKINDIIPQIFNDIIKKYDFKYKRFSSSTSILYRDNYVITMMVEREYIDIYFIKEEGDIINKYWIQPFILQDLTDEDRSNKREGDDWETKLINYLLIYEKVLRTKWESMLLGKMDWVEVYNKSKMPAVHELYPKEYAEYKEIFDEMKGTLIDYTPFIESFLTPEIKELYRIHSIIKDTPCWVNGILVPNFRILLKGVLSDVRADEMMERLVTAYKEYYMTDDIPGVYILNAAKYVQKYS